MRRRARPVHPPNPAGREARGLARQHSADEGAPGDRPDDAVDCDRERLLEPAYRRVGLRPEDAVELQSRARDPREVAERELLLDAAHRVAAAALPDGEDHRGPRLWTDDAVDREALALLEGRTAASVFGPKMPSITSA